MYIIILYPVCNTNDIYIIILYPARNTNDMDIIWSFLSRRGAFLSKNNPDTHRAHWIKYLRFHVHVWHFNILLWHYMHHGTVSDCCGRLPMIVSDCKTEKLRLYLLPFPCGNTNYNNYSNILMISRRSVITEENHRLVTSLCQSLSHTVVSSTPHHGRGYNAQLYSWYVLIALVAEFQLYSYKRSKWVISFTWKRRSIQKSY